MSIIASVVGWIVLLVRKITNKRISPKCNYIIWLAFIVALVCPISVPSKISIYNYIDVARIKEIERKSSIDILDLQIDGSISKEKEEISKLKEITSINNDKMSRNYLKFIIPDIWFIICFLKLTRVVSAYVLLDRITGNNQIEDDRMIGILERCKKKLKIKRDIKIIQQDFIKMPSTMGIIHVKIFLGSEILEFDDKSIEDIILHELSHYKRKDNVINVLIMVAKCFYWFNPMINRLFDEMKEDIELATDEMAIERMDENDKFQYCKVIVSVAQMHGSKEEAVLGLADNVKVLEHRIDMVLLKEKFDKHSKTIAMITGVIVLLIWLIFYPTSYGMFGIPKLYLELEDGRVIEATRLEEEDKLENVKTVKIGKDERMKLLTEGRRCEDYVSYTKVDLMNRENYLETIDIKKASISYFPEEECIYKFTLKYGKEKSIEYGVKIIVE